MMEPVIIVSGAASVDGSKDKKKAPAERLKRAIAGTHSDEAVDDSVDISKEARDRALGKGRRNILEYLKDEETN